jgi:cytidine deaminase
MDHTEQERRSLMRKIWDLNVNSDEGSYRLNRYGEPWLVENFYKDGVDTRVRFDHLYPRTAEELPRWERFQRFRQSAYYLYQEAIRARGKALSYRNFNVGSALLAYKSGVEHREAWGMFSGANTKHAPNMRPICSEPISINSAYMKDFTRVIGIVIVGELREEDEQAGLKTLHPCQECRWFMHDHPLIDDDTLVLTAKPPVDAMSEKEGGFDVREIRTVRQLLSRHQRTSGDDFN